MTKRSGRDHKNNYKEEREYAPFNPAEDADLFFGSDEEQQLAIDRLVQMASGDGGLHMICGGTVSGKSTVIDTVAEKLERDRAHFALLLTPEEIAAKAAPEQPLPGEMQALLDELHDKIYTQHYVLKDKSKPYYIVLAHGETAPSEYQHRDYLRRIAQLVKDAPSRGYQVLWIADAPISHLPPSIFKPSSSAVKRLKEHNESVMRLEKEFPGTVTHQTMPYDAEVTKEALWEHITRHGKPFLEYLHDETFMWDKSPEWKAAYTAALKEDRQAFDKAFDKLAKRAQLAQTPSAA